MPPVLAGRYELQVRLASGGMATVWQAVDRRLGRQVAVKVLAESLATDDKFRVRFEREARHIASLLHPNIVVVYDSGTDDDRLFMVMELVRGQSLRQRLARTLTLPTGDTLRMADDVLAALSHAHSAGIIHRDLKPGNILFTEDRVSKLADFGISIGSTETLSLTDAGSIVGTVSYASPEQIADEPLTPASDLYSMGCVLYQCVAGRPPFVGDNIAALAVRQRFATPEPLDAIAPGHAFQLSAVIMRALSKDPADRFATANDMALAIAEVRAENPEDRRPAWTARPRSSDAPEADTSPEPATTRPRKGSPRPLMGVPRATSPSSSVPASLRRPRLHRHWTFWIAAGVVVALVTGGIVKATLGPARASGPGKGTPVLAGVSCPTPDSCLAVGGHALLLDGGSWMSSATNASSAFFSAVSCANPTFCVAVDNVGDAQSFNGDTWSMPINIDFSRPLQSVACSTPSRCVAVDGMGNAIRFDGSTWYPAQNIDSTHFIVDVSCVGSGLCIAVDDRGDALALEGDTWSAPLEIDSPNMVTGVSCASSRFCVAVNNAGGATVFTGDAWVPPRKIDPSRIIQGISCASTRFCVAVDNMGDEVTFNGGAWSTPTAIDPSKIIERVSCVTPRFCVAVDDSGSEMTFSGKSWSAPHAIA